MDVDRFLTTNRAEFFNYALNLTKNVDDAEDVFQDASIAFNRNADNVSTDTTIVYMKRCIDTKHKDLCRARRMEKRDARKVVSMSAFKDQFGENQNPEEILGSVDSGFERVDDLSITTELLKRLSARETELLQYRMRDYSDTCQSGRLKTAWFRARPFIKAKLQRILAIPA